MARTNPLAAPAREAIACRAPASRVGWTRQVTEKPLAPKQRAGLSMRAYDPCGERCSVADPHLVGAVATGSRRMPGPAGFASAQTTRTSFASTSAPVALLRWKRIVSPGRTDRRSAYPVSGSMAKGSSGPRPAVRPASGRYSHRIRRAGLGRCARAGGPERTGNRAPARVARLDGTTAPQPPMRHDSHPRLPCTRTHDDDDHLLRAQDTHHEPPPPRGDPRRGARRPRARHRRARGSRGMGRPRAR